MNPGVATLPSSAFAILQPVTAAALPALPSAAPPTWPLSRAQVRDTFAYARSLARMLGTLADGRGTNVDNNSWVKAAAWFERGEKDKGGERRYGPFRRLRELALVAGGWFWFGVVPAGVAALVVAPVAALLGAGIDGTHTAMACTGLAVAGAAAALGTAFVIGSNVTHAGSAFVCARAKRRRVTEPDMEQVRTFVETSTQLRAAGPGRSAQSPIVVEVSRVLLQDWLNKLVEHQAVDAGVAMKLRELIDGLPAAKDAAGSSAQRLAHLAAETVRLSGKPRIERDDVTSLATTLGPLSRFERRALQSELDRVFFDDTGATRQRADSIVVRELTKVTLATPRTA